MSNNIIDKLFHNIIQYTKISIEPYHINNNIYNNIINTLKKKVEGKCNKNGFIIKVHKILNISDGIMQPENLNGNVIFNVSFNCKICIPIENKIIIGIIEIIKPNLIICLCNPLITFISSHNMENLDINNYKIGDFVKILILDKRINKNDNQIITTGKILEKSNNEEFKIFCKN